MIRTSHVGSFPLEHSEENIEMIIRDLYDVGIDVPPYPQMRSFIDIYLEPLVKAGILVRERNYYFINIDIDKASSLELPPPRVVEAEITINYISRYGLKFKALRAPVTGVFTLASKIYVEKDVSMGLRATLLPRLDVVKNLLVRYIRSFINYLVNLGFNVVFIDEPILGVIVGRKRILYGFSEDDIIGTLNSVLRDVGVERGIHVCGRISDRLFKILAQVDSVKYMNFEFHDSPKNLDVIEVKFLESYDKFIAPGIASSRKLAIEDINSMVKILNDVLKKSSGRVDLVSADCGFKELKGLSKDPMEAYRVSIMKLRNIVKAVNIFRKELV